MTLEVRSSPCSYGNKAHKLYNMGSMLGAPPVLTCFSICRLLVPQCRPASQRSLLRWLEKQQPLPPMRAQCCAFWGRNCSLTSIVVSIALQPTQLAPQGFSAWEPAFPAPLELEVKSLRSAWSQKASAVAKAFICPALLRVLQQRDSVHGAGTESASSLAAGG